MFLRDLELDGQARELRFGSHGLDSAPLPANVALQCHYTATAAPGTRRASLTFHMRHLATACKPAVLALPARRGTFGA